MNSENTESVKAFQEAENTESVDAFQEAERYINEIPRFTAKNTMDDTRAFLSRLGDPDEKMRIIHVAGTNGKGSVCAYLCSILRAAGYSVGLFTSPHLVDIRERFVVDQEMISREDFVRIFRKIYGMLDRNAPERNAVTEKKAAYHPSYFEYLFFMAMVYFAEKRPDFCILETGLGGRLDATNSVRRKELAVITHIGLDHVEYLGDTLEKIAGEKAGILQAGAGAVFWDTCPETTAVFERRASELGIIAQSVSEKDISFSNFNGKSIDFSVRTGYYGGGNVHGGGNIHGGGNVHGHLDLSLRTIAAYQRENCALAVRSIEALEPVFLACGKPVAGEHIQKGAWDCFWAGRMEEVLPEVYVDGAHNEDGIRAFLETVAADGCEKGRSLLFGVAKDKDYEHMMERLTGSGLFGRIAAAPMGNARALDDEGLEALLEKYPGCRFRVYENAACALRALLRERAGERIYIAGSLYLAGEIKELIGNDKF